jgi:hypothetical protein
MALEHLWDGFGIEAGWYPATSYNPQFSVDLQLRDATNHLVSFYLLDFDFPSRLQRIDLMTPAGEILDSQEASQFSGGKYYTWTLRGPVTARFTGLRGLPVLSGIFFDPETNEPPTIEVLSPTNGTRLLAPSHLVLRARVTDAEENIRQVEYFAAGRRITTMIEPPYEFLWNDVLSGEYALSAKATDAGGRTSESTGVQLDVGWPAARARSFSSDGETGGRWKSRYGRDGYLIANHATNLPVFAQVATAGIKAVTQLEPSTNGPALEHVNDGFGIEAEWLPEATGSNSFSFDLRLADGRNHRVALYVLNPDHSAGSQRVDILDTATGTLLDQQVISEYSNGRYLTWVMRGRLTIRITGLDGLPALSALFFDPETTPYENWTATYFTDLERATPAMSEPDADPDQDGLGNRMEYALGLNPRQPDVAGRPAVGLVAGYFMVQYTRPKTVTDVSLILEWSVDLVHWSRAEDALAPFSVSDEGNVQRITLRSIAPVSEQPVGFLRFSAQVLEAE